MISQYINFETVISHAYKTNLEKMKK